MNTETKKIAATYLNYKFKTIQKIILIAWHSRMRHIWHPILTAFCLFNCVMFLSVIDLMLTLNIPESVSSIAVIMFIITAISFIVAVSYIIATVSMFLFLGILMMIGIWNSVCEKISQNAFCVGK